MKKEILKDLYHKAADLCDRNDAWLFEKEFATLIVLKCVNLLDEDSAIVLLEHFGIEK